MKELNNHNKVVIALFKRFAPRGDFSVVISIPDYRAKVTRAGKKIDCREIK